MFQRIWYDQGLDHYGEPARPRSRKSTQHRVSQRVRPDTVYVLENPGIKREIAQSLDLATAVIEAYGGEPPEVNVTSIEDDVAFDDIHAHIRDAIEAVKTAGGEIVVDITPGRKFMSAIAFTAGIQYGADHVYYCYLMGAEHYGKSYPDIPRSAITLYDFTEELE